MTNNEEVEIYNNLHHKWEVNENLLQFYRSIFISSQSILIAVGAILFNKQFPPLAFKIIALLAVFTIWYLWFPVVRARHLTVDYYKFQLSNNNKIFKKCKESEYLKDRQKRKKINFELEKTNWRLTRLKMDLFLPIIFTIIWIILFTTAYSKQLSRIFIACFN